jgi:hypothetical protein
VELNRPARLKVTCQTSHWKNCTLQFLLHKENLWPPGGANFDPQSYNLNNLGRGILHKWRFHANYLTSSICIFRGEDFFRSFYYYLHIRKTYDTLGPIHSSASIWTTLVQVLLMILHTMYLSLKPSDKNTIHIQKMYNKNLYIWPHGRGQFWLCDYQFNNLGRVSLQNVSWQISNL